MRIYQKPLDAAKEVEREMKEMAIENQSYSSQDKIVIDNPDYNTKELIGYAYKIDPGWSRIDLDEVLNYFEIPIDWVYAEFDERLDEERPNPGEAWNLRKEVWEPFLHNDRFSYTYAERYWPQLERIIQELEAHPTSRQAVLQMYDYKIDLNNWGGKARVPCSLMYQFLLRQDQLHCVYTMRSCDFFTFFASDMVLTLNLLWWVAEALSVDVGSFTHFIGSLHAYQKEINKRRIF